MLFHLIPFEFHKYILFKSKCDIKSANYHKNYEALYGKTLSCLVLKNPYKIEQAINQAADSF